MGVISLANWSSFRVQTKLITPRTRLVVRSFEEEQVEDIPKGAPTCSTELQELLNLLLLKKKKKMGKSTMQLFQGSEIKRGNFIKTVLGL